MTAAITHCDCSEPLDASGKCPRCDAPALRRPGARAARVNRVLREREHEANHSRMLGSRETRAGIAKALPAWARYVNYEDFVIRERRR